MAPLVFLLLFVALTSGAPQGAPAWLLGRPVASEGAARGAAGAPLPKPDDLEETPHFFAMSSPVTVDESLVEAMQQAVQEAEGAGSRSAGEGESHALLQDPAHADYTSDLEAGPKTDGGADEDVLSGLWLSKLQPPPRRFGSVVDLYDLVARGIQPPRKRGRQPARKLSTLPSMPERRSARLKAACSFNAFRLVCWHSRSRAAMYRDKNRQ